VNRETALVSRKTAPTSPEWNIAAGPLHASMAATEVGTIVQALEYLVARVPEN
jgi:hypothetical protein